MKILITGYTTRMFGSTRIKGDYITFSFILEDILKELGHEVHRKQIKINEELAYVYNYAFCGVAPLNSITAGKVPETHYVLDTMPTRSCIYADDWSFCGYGNSVKYALKNWDSYLKYKRFPYDDWAIDNTEESLNRLIKMDNPGNNPPVLAPMFKWGDHQFLMRENLKANLITLDPSPFIKYPTVKIPDYSKKEAQWVMAALSNHSRWVNKQGFRLPVKYVGNRSLGDGILLGENETIQLFANSFGVLSTGYPSAGSGWWRTRYLNTAWAESLMYCDPRDQDIMGDPFKITAENAELLLRHKRYVEVVQAQREWLESNVMKRDEAISVIEGLLK